MKKTNECMCSCCDPKHKKWMAAKMLALGLLVLANSYWKFISLEYLIAIVLIIASIAKLTMKNCCK